MRNPHHPEIIVIDPRATETSMAATQHLPLYPKSDLTLLYGIARILIERDWIDRDFIAAHTSGFEAFAEFVQDIHARSRRRGNAAAGRGDRAIRRHDSRRQTSFVLVDDGRQSKPSSRAHRPGDHQSGADDRQHRPAGHRRRTRSPASATRWARGCSATRRICSAGTISPIATHRRKVADVLDIDEATIPHEASWPYHRILEGILRGEIRGLWIVATNPAHSWINQGMARDVLERLDFLVVQDMYHTTETAQLAHLVLPAAAGVRRTARSSIPSGGSASCGKWPAHRARRSPISISSNWSPITGAAAKCFANGSRPKPCFNCSSNSPPASRATSRASRTTRCSTDSGGIQWPYPAGSRDAGRELGNWTRTHPRERRLFEDGQFYHADGRARFICESPRAFPEQPNAKYPFVLLTGRGSAAQWHTQTRTAKSAVLRKLYPQ